MAVYDVRSGSQSPQFDTNGLSPEDRRVLLGSMLRWLMRRYRCGQPVRRNDLCRLPALADDSGPSGDLGRGQA
jgi:hypothetical protein